jgi:hypothetical protein
VFDSRWVHLRIRGEGEYKMEKNLENRTNTNVPAGLKNCSYGTLIYTGIAYVGEKSDSNVLLGIGVGGTIACVIGACGIVIKDYLKQRKNK